MCVRFGGFLVCHVLLYFCQFFSFLGLIEFRLTWEEKVLIFLMSVYFYSLVFLYVLFGIMQEFCLTEEIFDLWNQEKKKLNKQQRIVHPKPREIWYVKIWINVWREIFWKKWFFRPVLVISKIWNMYFCIPMTTKTNQLKHDIPLLSFHSSKPSYLVLNQWKVFDTQRFFSRGGILSCLEFEQIKKLLRSVYFPEVL